jgi:hypothetical protein
MDETIYARIHKNCLIVMQRILKSMIVIIFLMFAGCSGSKITCEMCDEDYQNYQYSKIETADLYKKLSCDWCFTLLKIQNDLELMNPVLNYSGGVRKWVYDNFGKNTSPEFQQVSLQLRREVIKDTDLFYTTLKETYLLKFKKYSYQLDSLERDGYMDLLDSRVLKDIGNYSTPDQSSDEVSVQLRRYSDAQVQLDATDLWQAVRERIRDYKKSIITLRPKVVNAISKLEKS